MAITVYMFELDSVSELRELLASKPSKTSKYMAVYADASGPTEVPLEIAAKAEKKLIASSKGGLTDVADKLLGTQTRGKKPDPHCERSKILLYMRDFPNTTKSQLAKRFSWNHVNGLMTEGKNPLLTPVPSYEIPKFTALGEERLSYIESKLLQEAAA